MSTEPQTWSNGLPRRPREEKPTEHNVDTPEPTGEHVEDNSQTVDAQDKPRKAKEQAMALLMARPSNLAALDQFTPSANQAGVLSYMQANGYDSPMSAACESVGITAQAGYHWWHTPGFAAWWQAEADRHFARQLPRVWQSALRDAEWQDRRTGRGSTDAKRLFAERFDANYKPANELTVNITVSEQIRELREAAR